MPQTEIMSAICSQLLTPDDINLSEEIIAQIKKEKIIVQVLIEDDPDGDQDQEKDLHY